MSIVQRCSAIVPGIVLRVWQKTFYTRRCQSTCPSESKATKAFWSSSSRKAAWNWHFVFIVFKMETWSTGTWLNKPTKVFSSFFFCFLGVGTTTFEITNQSLEVSEHRLLCAIWLSRIHTNPLVCQQLKPTSSTKNRLVPLCQVWMCSEMLDTTLTQLWWTPGWWMWMQHVSY